jgi:hydrogenase expression/formation protein HypC
MCLAVPGEILSIENDLLRSGRVDFGGITKVVNLSYVPEAKVGDYVLVHVGFAITIIDELEAEKALKYLYEMGEIEELKETGFEIT